MPHRFVRRWLSFDEGQPTQTRLARRFVFTCLAMLLIAGLLALLAAR